MRAEYTKETFIVDKTEDEKEKELMRTIFKTKKSLQEANNNYQHAEGKLIDYFLYTIKAEQAKLDYLMAKAKEKGLSLDLADSSKIKREV